MSEQILSDHRRTWETKPVLRAIYHDFYRRITAMCRPGETLEIGGGSGILKNFLPDVISTDVVFMPWLDAVADAQNLPFRSGRFGNIVGIDVLHHIEMPRRFFFEVERVLAPGGRLILVEPAITPVSWVYYKFLHPEPVELDANPLMEQEPDPDRAPFDANQAIPTLLFGRHRREFAASFPQLRLLSCEKISLIAYPLSGGFRRWSLVPERLVDLILKFEDSLTPVLGPLMAFRLFITIERIA